MSVRDSTRPQCRFRFSEAKLRKSAGSHATPSSSSLPRSSVNAVDHIQARPCEGRQEYSHPSLVFLISQSSNGFFTAWTLTLINLQIVMTAGGGQSHRHVSNNSVDLVYICRLPARFPTIVCEISDRGDGVDAAAELCPCMPATRVTDG